MELKYKNMNFIVGQLFGMDFEKSYYDMVIVYKDNGVEEQYEYVGYFWGSTINEETTKEYAIETIEKWLEQKQLNKTLYDLFVEKESFVVEIKVDEKHYLFVENLDKYGGSKSYDYDIKLLSNNILVEIMEYVDDIEEYDYLCNVEDNKYYVDLNTKVCDLIDIVENLI